MNEAEANYVKVHSKSQGVGFALTLLFGPLGLFYSSWVAALILSVICVAGFATVLIPLIGWVLAMVFSFFAVSKHNQRVVASALLGGSNQAP